MRLSDEQLKAGFVHSSRIVRDVVTGYFGDTFTRDPDVTRRAIRGVEQYGWRDFLAWPHTFCDLPVLDEDSFDWVCRQIERTDAAAPDFNLCARLAWMLSKADVAVLTRQQSRLLALDVMDAASRETVVRRVELAAIDPDECWQALEAHCRRVADVDSFKAAQIPQAKLLLEPLLRAGDRFVPRIMEVLQRPLPDADEPHPDNWLNGFMIILAGHMRLEEAAPLIWDRLEADWDWYNEEATKALTRIGTPSVIQVVRERYAQSEWHVRLYSNTVFEAVRCDETIDALRALLPGEEDDALRSRLGVVAAAQFDERVTGLAMSVWDEDPLDVERGQIRNLLVTYSYLSGWELPQRDQWEASVNEYLDRILRNIADLSPRSDAEPAGRRATAFDDLDEDILDAGFLKEHPDTIVRVEPRIGRNDPCPCGSGKKYKKCCLNAESRSQ